MTAAMFRVAALAEPGHELQIDGAEGRHAVRVKRLRLGETVLLTDGSGDGVQAVVLGTDNEVLTVRVEAVLPSEHPRPYVIAAQALAKGDRDELAIATMTEMGVAEVIPWQAERSIVKWAAGPRGERQHARWVATVQEAAKQSRRLWVPPVREAMTTGTLVDALSAESSVLVLHEQATQTMASAVASLADTERISIVIGPEGGISEPELDRFVAAGAVPVRIAANVLRTSTAGVVALAQLSVLVPQ